VGTKSNWDLGGKASEEICDMNKPVVELQVRAVAAVSVCCHSFRATGVTEYMNSVGALEIAQRIAGHTSPATTRIYDRSRDR